VVINARITRLRSHICYVLLAICLSLTFATSAVAQSPTGWWKFDDGFGTRALDYSGHAHYAMLYNRVSWVPGKSGDAVSANSANSQYVAIPAINFNNTSAVTVAYWVKRTYSTSGGHTLFEATTNYNNSTTGFGLFPDDNTCGGMYVALRGNNGYVGNCYSQPSSGVWHHMAVVFDKTQTGGDQVKLYVDGGLQAVTRNLYSTTNTNSFGNNPVYIFSQGGSSQFTTGIMDDFRLFSLALTPSQIMGIYGGGQGTLTASPSSLNFGNVNVGSFLALPVTVTNTGSSPVTVSSVTISGAEFSLSPIQTPFTLQQMGSAHLTVTFSPTQTGAASGTVTVVSNASNPQLSIPLSGSGVSNIQHLVTLNWIASTSPGIAGYNAFRSTTSGGPYTQLNSSLISTTNYVDQGVTSGATYYYVTTAVNNQGLQSSNSNEATATVP
jgi:hypothetical protein